MRSHATSTKHENPIAAQTPAAVRRSQPLGALHHSAGNRAVRRAAQSFPGQTGGGTGTGPMHQALAEAWRCRHGYAPGQGPEDSDIIYGGLIADSLAVSLNVTLLDGIPDTVARDVDEANQVWAPANVSFALAGRPRTLSAAISSSIVNSDNALDCGLPAPTAEESALIAQNYSPGVLNVYYVPHFVNCSDAGFTMTGATADPVIVMNQGWNAGTTGVRALPHELGHALGLPHRGDGYQLMHDGLRAGDNLICSEMNDARSSPYAQPAAAPQRAAPPPGQPAQPPQPAQPVQPAPKPQPAQPPSPASQPETAVSPTSEPQPRVTLQIPFTPAAFSIPLFGSTSAFVPAPTGQRPWTDTAYQPNVALGLNYSFHRGETGWEIGLFGQLGQNVATGPPPPHIGSGSGANAGVNVQAYVQPAYVWISNGPHQIAVIGQLGAGHTSSDVPLVAGGTIDSSAMGISAAIGGQYTYSFVPNQFQFNVSLLGGAAISILDTTTPPAGVDRVGASGVLMVNIGFQWVLPLSWYSRGQ